MAQPCDTEVNVSMTYISRFSDFPYILKTIWCMNIVVLDNESVWHNIWPQNKCRSLWPIFHGTVILPYIFLKYEHHYYESVWPQVWPQNKYRSLWPIFHGQVILRYILKTIWCMNIILWDYRSLWPDFWPKNKCRSMWPIFHGPVISLISPRLFGAWVSYFQIMRQCDPNFDLKVNMSTWPIFYGLVILLNIFKIIWWMNIIVGIMDQCDT